MKKVLICTAISLLVIGFVAAQPKIPKEIKKIECGPTPPDEPGK